MSSSSYTQSSRSISSASLIGALSNRTASVRPLSVYGGADGSGVRVSQAKYGFDLINSFDQGVGVALNEKATMKNLNDRLATYLNKVRALEQANAELERQIWEWSQKKTAVKPDYSPYFATIAELRKKIHNAGLENARIILNIDNAKLAAEDFRVKYENELAMHQSVASDVSGLRRVLDELTVSRSDLEMRIEELKEELVYLKKNHEDEMAALRNNMTTSSVNVDVDAPPQQDLSRVLEDVRKQYESVVEKNRREMESWYKAKFDKLSKQVIKDTTDVQTFHSEINELKRTLQSLEIELQSQLSLKAALEGTLSDTEARNCVNLSQLQGMINSLQDEITQILSDITRQDNEYKTLLDIKTRLEMEIAEYRRLLEGEDFGSSKKTKVAEYPPTPPKPAECPPPPPKREPVITKRVRTVVEEVVDGKVVSVTEDVDTEVVKK